MPKDTPPIGTRIDALVTIIQALKELDYRSQVRVMRAAVVICGLTLYGRDEPNEDETTGEL